MYISINGVSIGAVNFQANDNTGALVDSINAVSSKQVFPASIDGNGALTLSSEKW